MNSKTEDDGDVETTLDGLLIRWEEAREGGLEISAEALAGGRPELAGELRRRIEALRALGAIEASAGGGSVTEGSGTPRADRRDGAPRAVSSRAEFGSLRFHAEGGLGEVFLARHAELNREVALKFLKRGRAGDPESRRRFLVEAEVTGRLEHPGVVPVYALGLDGEGVPCYAMRFVRGRTLHEAILELHGRGPGPDPPARSPAFRALLKRFASACYTVAYAHSRGVIHRDLKPRNVMLGPFDETLVVDWGLAKSLGEPGGAGPAGVAEEGSETVGLIGTPAFLSPEQAGAGPTVGPPSDVFALGATLYAILAGRAPFEGRHVGEVIEKARNADFPPPRRLNPEVPRPLEAVCLKAMALRPEGRYPGALELAADVERWLADEPVSAWREPWAIRARRWMTRNRYRMVAGSAVLAASIAIPAAISVVEARNNRALQAANARAEQVRLFLTEDVLAQADPTRNARSRRVTVEEVLDRAAATIAARFAGEPEVEAAVRETLGQSYLSLGEYGKADPQFVRVLALRRAALPEGHLDLSLARGNLAALRNAQGRYAEAEDLLDQALGALRREQGPEHAETLKAPIHLAELLQNRGRAAEAVGVARRVVDARTRALGGDAPETLRAVNYLAMALVDLERLDEAEGLHRRVLDARRRALPADDPAVLASMANLATVLHYQKKDDRAVPMFRAVHEGMARVLGEEHPETLTVLNNLGLILAGGGDFAGAEAAYRRALAGRRRKLGADNLETVVSELGLADAVWSLGRPDEAIGPYRHVVRVRLDELGDSDPLGLGPANNLAGLLLNSGEAAEAEALFRKVVPGLRRNPPRFRPQLGNALVMWGWSLLDSGRPDEAEAPLREGLAIRREPPGAPAASIANAENLLGASLAARGRFVEAEPLLVGSYPPLVGSPFLRRGLGRIAALYRAWGKPDEARRWALIVDDLAFPAENPFARP